MICYKSSNNTTYKCLAILNECDFQIVYRVIFLVLLFGKLDLGIIIVPVNTTNIRFILISWNTVGEFSLITKCDTYVVGISKSDCKQ